MAVNVVHKCISDFMEVDDELLDIKTKGHNNCHTEAPVEDVHFLSILKACCAPWY
jgi:hypothetical protein